MTTMPIRIPVCAINERLAINEREAHEKLGLNDGRSERAKRSAWYKFCTKHGIKPEPGRVFSLKKIEQAMAA